MERCLPIDRGAFPQHDGGPQEGRDAVADPQHFEILKQGVVTWNNWRMSIWRTLPILTLDMKDSKWRNLHAPNLSGADLSGADLGGADLRIADLSGANLRGARLIAADLSRTNLMNTNLTEAYFWETVFANVDLNNVIGLATCNHIGPSTVDHRTLQKSGPLPLSFLQGVGLPDNIIKEYQPSRLNQTIQHYSCFISYSAKDDDFANALLVRTTRHANWRQNPRRN
jgi:hypothetical protein